MLRHHGAVVTITVVVHHHRTARVNVDAPCRRAITEDNTITAAAAAAVRQRRTGVIA